MTQLRIGGFVPFTTTDYPGHLAAVVFCQGCPWRCGYCHNPHLLPVDGSESHAWIDILAFLETRRGLLDAVVFSGGEPTLQKGLGEAMGQVRRLGFKIGLHTAGMYPRRLARVLPLTDWVGLDIKAPRHLYARVTCIPDSADSVYASLGLIQAAGIDYQPRCTWHKGLMNEADIARLNEEVRAAGGARLAIQDHRP